MGNRQRCGVIIHQLLPPWTALSRAARERRVAFHISSVGDFCKCAEGAILASLYIRGLSFCACSETWRHARVDIVEASGSDLFDVVS